MTTPDPILLALINVLNAARKTVDNPANKAVEVLTGKINEFDRIVIDQGVKSWLANKGTDEKCGLGCGPTERTCPKAKC